jgi:hypothetical protein
LEEALQEANHEFAERCQQRHEFGSEKYGELTFLGIDSVEEAMLEVLDLANYARYTYIKLVFLKQAIAAFAAKHPAADSQGWIPTKEMFKS